MPDPWEPTPTDVADLAPHRTLGDDGQPTGGFDASTQFSAAQVEAAADTVAEVVRAALGGTVPEQFHRTARRVAVYGVLADLELATYPEQSAQGNSPAVQWWQRYRAALDALVEQVEATGVDVPGGEAMPWSSPQATFPAPSYRMESEAVV